MTTEELASLVVDLLNAEDQFTLASRGPAKLAAVIHAREKVRAAVIAILEPQPEQTAGRLIEGAGH